MSFLKQGMLFREVEVTDLFALRAWRNDPDMSLGWRDPRSVQTHLNQHRWFETLDRFNQAFIATLPDKVVTDVGLLRFRLDYEMNEAKLTGTDVNPDVRGIGYGKRILRAGAEYVMHDLGFHRCTAEALETNTAAIHIIRAAGFKPEGTLRDYVWRDGKWCNWHIFSLLRSEL